jgi:fermentation-respiration switch protein FrsA (DUF1100 family)
MIEDNSKKWAHKKMKKGISLFLASIFVALTLVTTKNYYLQEKIIFRAETLPKEFSYAWELPHEEVFLKTESGGTINGLHFKKPRAKGVVLFFHGRGKNLSFWGKRAEMFLDQGYSFFVIDYRGFGKSSPGFKEKWLLEDGHTAYDYLKTIYKESEITVYGQSLGTSVATYVASIHSPKRLILEAPFYSMFAVASYTKPYLPEWILRLILKYPLETNLWIKNVNAPIYIFHGTNDLTIPFSHAARLYDEIKDSKAVEFIVLQDWGHDHIPQHPIYSSRIARIL